MIRSLKSAAGSLTKLVERVFLWLLQPFFRLRERWRHRAWVKRQVRYAVAAQWLVERLRNRDIEVLDYGIGDKGPRVRARVRPEQVWDYCVVYSAARQRFPELTEAELCGEAHPSELLTAGHGFIRSGSAGQERQPLKEANFWEDDNS